MQDTKETIMQKMSVVRWEDAGIDELLVKYDSVILRLTESSGRHVGVKFDSHIALNWSGHWDENIVESCSVLTESKEISAALEMVRTAYGENPDHGGGIRNFAGPWFSFSIRMTDDCSVISIVFQGLNVEV
jgi:hypothetical protein